jgi:hypothetical protein
LVDDALLLTAAMCAGNMRNGCAPDQLRGDLEEFQDMGGRCSIVKAVTLIVIGVLLVVATQPSRAEIRGDGGKIRLLYMPSGTNAFLPFVIQKLGLDRKYGFELQAVPQATTQAGITAIQAGAAELGTFGWNDIQRMRNAGIKVVSVAPFLHWGADFLVARVKFAGSDARRH